ncbi:hypothetical protein EJ06DRAFT_158697 [Trichodelitschia bisporula]|uniref:Uncharacterized protein n=1 Tax=Trichodelitschia bisporula TaxID=703511 RepID=A0A6G1HMG0_9PEZI|nr:hypothetical protein EJ06DRAFT_158697 [Trichodelitschia bisporula]
MGSGAAASNIPPHQAFHSTSPTPPHPYFSHAFSCTRYPSYPWHSVALSFIIAIAHTVHPDIADCAARLVGSIESAPTLSTEYPNFKPIKAVLRREIRQRQISPEYPASLKPSSAASTPTAISTRLSRCVHAQPLTRNSYIVLQAFNPQPVRLPCHFYAPLAHDPTLCISYLQARSRGC